MQRTSTFVCPVCNRLIVEPAGNNGFMRCPKGHRLQGLYQGPIARIYLMSLVLPLLASGLLLGVARSRTANAAMSALLVVWAIYLLVRGVRFRQSAEPARGLARQFLAAAAAFLTVAAAILLANPGP